MFQRRILAGLTAFALLPLAAAGAQEFKGQIKIGIHKTKLEAGKVYTVVLDCKAPAQAWPFVQVFPGELLTIFGKAPREDAVFFIPPKTDEYAFYVVSTLGPVPQDVIDYTLSIKPVPQADKPVLQEKVVINANDPIYQPRGARYKAYTVAMKANHYYVIDLTKTGIQDPYLFVEDADKKIVVQKGVSGDGTTARLLFRPIKDGDYRIIATTFDNAVGEMPLIVRMLPFKK
jgi:hypothetical protein